MLVDAAGEALPASPTLQSAYTASLTGALDMHPSAGARNVAFPPRRMLSTRDQPDMKKGDAPGSQVNNVSSASESATITLRLAPPVSAGSPFQAEVARAPVRRALSLIPEQSCSDQAAGDGPAPPTPPRSASSRFSFSSFLSRCRSKRVTTAADGVLSPAQGSSPRSASSTLPSDHRSLPAISPCTSISRRSRLLRRKRTLSGPRVPRMAATSRFVEDLPEWGPYTRSPTSPRSSRHWRRRAGSIERVVRSLRRGRSGSGDSVNSSVNSAVAAGGTENAEPARLPAEAKGAAWWRWERGSKRRAHIGQLHRTCGRFRWTITRQKPKYSRPAREVDPHRQQARPSRRLRLPQHLRHLRLRFGRLVQLRLVQLRRSSTAHNAKPSQEEALSASPVPVQVGLHRRPSKLQKRPPLARTLQHSTASLSARTTKMTGTGTSRSRGSSYAAWRTSMRESVHADVSRRASWRSARSSHDSFLNAEALQGGTGSGARQQACGVARPRFGAADCTRRNGRRRTAGEGTGVARVIAQALRQCFCKT